MLAKLEKKKKKSHTLRKEMWWKSPKRDLTQRGPNVLYDQS